jgi:hypothetical protein
MLMAVAASAQGAATPPKPGAAGGEESGAGSIRHGCIQNYLIKRVSFNDDRTGVIELSGGNKVQITLRNRCSGIRQDGYVHKPVNNRFCEGDILRVMRSGGVCVVDRLEPYVEPAEDRPGGEAAPASGD